VNNTLSVASGSQSESIHVQQPNPGQASEATAPGLQGDVRDDEVEESGQSIAPKRRRTCGNKLVTVSERSFDAIRTEVVTATKNFLDERVDSEISSNVQQLAAVFRAPSAREMEATATIVLTKMKMDPGGMQLMDDCVDLFIAVPNLATTDGNLSHRFNLVRTNVAADSPLAVVVNLVLSAAPHSMVVERAVSHYNIFRNDKRLSMSLQSVNDRLLIALNGNGTGQFDPRPAVAGFLCAKQRRYREPKLETYSHRPFISKFFRMERDNLI
jgi:hypothetical protein